MPKENENKNTVALKVEWCMFDKLYWNMFRGAKQDSIVASLQMVKMLLEQAKEDIDLQIEVINTKGEAAWHEWMETGIPPEIE